ncbi:putative Phthiotriol/phenolphthiotriol dimycocerosates methyltransferase [Bradyrhizobium sp. ORS 285]|uniref:class I SAM-dependent methyltransferase n=1 Tax=Bradyrhizobium sp. ORS 285 TaxID=115808 RepID=UPI0002406CAB|nr:class I SAM-dependent methyltransferase [Bradyrhizobium sp. ORS 285]CCD83742.1 putative Phthiotriol/phenolphthiotriol dimycocerosates methyltransferase [Bradyrhizobium sp. ORS 285]SMX59288.1 putative Phthiotriol/phenolphthiotriol dimycocerosates methyltransferase [Bradyrhizobium sp. ORS 285]
MSDHDTYDLPDKATAPEAFKSRIQRFYGYWNRRVDGLPFGEVSLFMNWGYLPSGQDEARLLPTPNAVNASSVRLILELVGDTDLAGRDVLDIGCGRGGTVHTLLNYFQPRGVTGIDLTPENIAFCRRAVDAPRSRFLEGDAEQLPFADQSFDVVTNVESSHCYPHIARFYAEVARVLRPGGTFLYTDVFDRDDVMARRAEMGACGLDVLGDRDITPNVMLARAAEGDAQLAGFGAGAPAEEDVTAQSDARVLDLIMARPGSEMQVAMTEGRLSYRILRARKRERLSSRLRGPHRG